jgi:tRNA(fMet)-specific endonuclease VapC
MKYLLDTDHISLLEHRRGPQYAALVARLNLHAVDGIGVCVVSFQEQMLGANNRIQTARTDPELLRGYELMSGLLDHYRRFPVLPFDAAALADFHTLRQLKVRVGTRDLRIAAIARSRNLTLVTRNLSDFGRVPDLRVEDWTT